MSQSMLQTCHADYALKWDDEKLIEKSFPYMPDLNSQQ